MKKPTGPIDIHSVVANSGLHKDLRSLAAEAADYGWTCKRSGKGGVTVRSPEGDASFYIPLGTKDPGRLVKDARTALNTWVVRTVKEDFAEKGVSVDGTSGVHPTARCKDHDIEFTSWEGLAAHIRAEHPVASEAEERDGGAESSALDEAIAQADELIEGVESGAASPSATMSTSGEKVRPWLAILERHGNGTVSLYESEAVLEVEAPDGGTLYRCAVEGCEYEAPLPRSVRSHYGGHVVRGEVEPVSGERKAAQTGVRDPQYLESGRLKTPLSREIYVAMRSRSRHRNEGLSKYATALSEIIVANRRLAHMDEDHEEQDETGEVPAARSVLDQIRELVGAPDMEALETRLAEERVAREKAEAEAARVRGVLRTFASLASEETE